MQRARAVDAFVMWTLSVLLAALFLLVGLPKVIGTASVGFQAAAMEGFPPWLRIVIGSAEVICAVGLLIPPLATVAATCLAFLMIPAAATQFASGQPGIWVPVVVFALLVYVAWRRNSKYVADEYSEFAGTPHPLLKEGIIAGLIGALTIAVWFFLLDTIAGHPFYTPATLGRGLISVFGPIPPEDGMTTFVIVYTIFHFTAFLFVGLLASLIVTIARYEPSILLGFAILFAVSEIGIYGLVALIGQATPIRNAWLPIMAGNVLAAGAMGFYFWKRHGELEHELRHAFDYKRDEDDGEQGAEVEAVVTERPAAP